MSDQTNSPWSQPKVILHSQLILSSFQNWLGRPLLTVSGSPEAQAKALFEAPFFVASHGIEADPIYNYGNRFALELWELDWEHFTKLPSRYSAEAVEQGERSRLLAETQTKGFSDWRGVRISSTGKRWLVADGIVWNIIDEQRHFCGQAATFTSYSPL